MNSVGDLSGRSVNGGSPQFAFTGSNTLKRCTIRPPKGKLKLSRFVYNAAQGDASSGLGSMLYLEHDLAARQSGQRDAHVVQHACRKRPGHRAAWKQRPTSVKVGLGKLTVGRHTAGLQQQIQ